MRFNKLIERHKMNRYLLTVASASFACFALMGNCAVAQPGVNPWQEVDHVTFVNNSSHGFFIEDSSGTTCTPPTAINTNGAVCTMSNNSNCGPLFPGSPTSVTYTPSCDTLSVTTQMSDLSYTGKEVFMWTFAPGACSPCGCSNSGVQNSYPIKWTCSSNYVDFQGYNVTVTISDK